MSFPVRAITLDLDDTLWPFAPVGARVEQVQHTWLLQHCPRTAARFPIDAMRALREQVNSERPDLAHDFSQLRKLDIVSNIGTGVRLRLRVPPRGHVMARRIEEGAKFELWSRGTHVCLLGEGDDRLAATINIYRNSILFPVSMRDFCRVQWRLLNDDVLPWHRSERYCVDSAAGAIVA